jgi:nitroreductase
MDSADVRPRNFILDDIIMRRRSCRAFSAQVPLKELIMQIITAGMHAPYAALVVVGREDFRKFFVIEGFGEKMKTIRGIIERHVHQMGEQLERKAAGDSSFAEATRAFRSRLRRGVSSSSPWFIVVAEPKGFPLVAPQSIAHCMQNMWLKATALDLGMQLVSVVEAMGDSPGFCRLLDIPPGEDALNGCAIGFPAEFLPPSQRPNADAATIWLR